MMDRRAFLWSVAGVGLGGATRWSRGVWARTRGGRSLDRIGLQLYTLRTLLEEDFEGTLREVAAAGYDEVEFHNYFGRSPEEVRALLDELGLAAPASHVSLAALRQDLDGTIETARAVGHEFLVCPWLSPEERTSAAGYRALAAFFNGAGEACREAGLRFGYHNHEFEFEIVDGEVPMDLLLEGTDPDLVCFELDLFWIRRGGRDPLEYFARHPGRFALCHVKDMTADGRMVEVGAGAIDFASIFAQSQQAGLEHYFVEHDEPADPLASVRASHDYLAALNY